MSSSACCLTMCAFSFSLHCIMVNVLVISSGPGYDHSQDELLCHGFELQLSVRSISFPLIYVFECVECFIDFNICKTDNAFSLQTLPPGY